MDTTIVTEIITQWGLSGLVLLGAAYVLWDNYKTNKTRCNIDVNNIFDKLSEITDAKIDSLNLKFVEMQNASNEKFQELREQITEFQTSQQAFNEGISSRIESLENKLYKSSEDVYDMEATRMKAVVQAGPSIHTILKTSLNNCNAHHIFLAVFHNGAAGITGIPYVKFDVVAEKFLPVDYPKDHELIRYYKSEDVLHHNKLGSILMQHEVSSFDLSEDTLKEIDSIEYKRCLDIGIKHISYVSIKDSHSRIAGFLCAYSFDEPLNEDEFIECAQNLEGVYNSMTCA